MSAIHAPNTRYLKTGMTLLAGQRLVFKRVNIVNGGLPTNGGSGLIDSSTNDDTNNLRFIPFFPSTTQASDFYYWNYYYSNKGYVFAGGSAYLNYWIVSYNEQGEEIRREHIPTDAYTPVDIQEHSIIWDIEVKRVEIHKSYGTPDLASDPPNYGSYYSATNLPSYDVLLRFDEVDPEEVIGLYTIAHTPQASVKTATINYINLGIISHPTADSNLNSTGNYIALNSISHSPSYSNLTTN